MKKNSSPAFDLQHHVEQLQAMAMMLHGSVQEKIQHADWCAHKTFARLVHQIQTAIANNLIKQLINKLIKKIY